MTRHKSKFEESKAHYKERISALVESIREYDPKVNHKDIDEALNWSKRRTKTFKSPVWNDMFSDPLDVARTLVDLEKADHETVLASILYTSVIPEGKNGLDRNALDRIKDRFGPRVCHIVEDTLSLWSLDRLPSSTQAPKDNLRDYELMALLVARSRASILIRSVQSYVNISDFDADTTREKRENVLKQAEIMADLAYLAKFPELRRVILNESFRIRDPERYADIRRHTSSVRRVDDKGLGVLQATNLDGSKVDQRVKLTPEEIVGVQDMIADFFERDSVLLRERYKLEIRVKDAHSAAEKTERKNQQIEQLGDIHGGRVIIDDDYIQEKYSRAMTDKEIAQKKTQDPEQHACEILYWKFSKQFGRNNPNLKYLYEELALKDPSGKDPTKDDRFDNYYRDTKPSGYRAIQDTFFFVIHGKLVEIEMQFVGEKTHENNTNGPPSHRLMKTNQFKNLPVIQAWEQYSDQITWNEKGERPRVPYAAIYAPNNDIKVIKGDASGCKATDYITQYFHEIQEMHPQISSTDDIVGVRVDNANPLMNRDPDVPLSPVARLRSGYRVTGFELRAA